MSDLPLFLQQSDLLVFATCLASIAFGAGLRVLVGRTMVRLAAARQSARLPSGRA